MQLMQHNNTKYINHNIKAIKDLRFAFLSVHPSVFHWRAWAMCKQ